MLALALAGCKMSLLGEGPLDAASFLSRLSPYVLSKMQDYAELCSMRMSHILGPIVNVESVCRH